MHSHVTEAIEVLKQLGFPSAQQNEMTGLCLLALVDLCPNYKWKKCSSPLIGVTPIIDWIENHYEKKYAPNTRETIRKHAMHVFVRAGIAVQNPDKPERAINSPRWVYQIEPNALELLRTFGARDWRSTLTDYLVNQPPLTLRYSKARKLLRIPIKMLKKLTLTPGAHSELIRAIIDDFGAQFVPGGQLVYVGDTGLKWGYFDEKLLKSLGVTVKEQGIMPDVIIYCRKRNWLILAEAVTSDGPVDSARHESLKNLFGTSSAGLVFVTAFPDEKMLRKFITRIAWETEVWRADAPTHLIHFNGERFLGPYS